MHPRYIAAVAGAASQTQSFYMPPEGNKHERCIMALPGLERPETKDYVKGLTSDLMRIAGAISQFEPVTMVVGNRQLNSTSKLASKVQGEHGIEIIERPENNLDLWMRDIAATYVFSNDKHQMRDSGGKTGDQQEEGSNSTVLGELLGLNMNFNGWGHRFGHDTTTKFAGELLKAQDLRTAKTWLVGEGGGIEVDGEGTLIAAESSWVNENRNPEKSRDEIEKEFKRVFGVTTVIWTPGVKGRDVTDAHIDATARFIKPGKVMISKPPGRDPKSPWWFDSYKKTRDIIRTSKDAKGRSLEVVEVVEADPEQMSGFVPDDLNNNDLVISYVNYYLPNGGVVMPSFGHKAMDDKAFRQFQEVFPDRKVVQVQLNELRYMGGGIHCSTQQIPARG